MDNKQNKIEQELRAVKSELARDEKKIASDEARIIKDEKEIKKMKLSMRGLMTLVLIIVAIGGAILAYLVYENRSVYIEKSDVEAPAISLSSTAPGTLNEMLVQAGDTVSANQVVARVGDQLIKTKIAGVVTKADSTVGQSYAAGQTVVAMIDPTQLHVVGHLDENKGLDRVRVGQYVTFTADAFGSKQYTGIVDEISPEARSGDIVFTISDARQEQVFDVKVRFDTTLYPELKNGMSARIWVTI